MKKKGENDVLDGAINENLNIKIKKFYEKN
jgi:hypothetical protein